MIHTGNTLTIDFCDFVFSKILDILLHDSKIYFLREVLSNVRFCIHCNSEKVKEKGIFRVFKKEYLSAFSPSAGRCGPQ